MNAYTVVGMQSGWSDASSMYEGSFVEHVRASRPSTAVKAVRRRRAKIEGCGRMDVEILAVFEGKRADVYEESLDR